MLTPNELAFTFRGCYVCANFGENRSRNATVRVRTNGYTDTQTQTGIIICPMLYAIAMGQINIIRRCRTKITVATNTYFEFHANFSSFAIPRHVCHFALSGINLLKASV